MSLINLLNTVLSLLKIKSNRIIFRDNIRQIVAQAIVDVASENDVIMNPLLLESPDIISRAEDISPTTFDQICFTDNSDDLLLFELTDDSIESNPEPRTTTIIIN